MQKRKSFKANILNVNVVFKATVITP